jgi:serine/threonine protein phosphatase 1
MSKFMHHAINTAGRDYAVGDIHGHFARLQASLDRLGFDPATDRLFSVGDLVDRGPHSEQSLDWLGKPWFFAVQGNHEALAIQVVEGVAQDPLMYRASGGGWFLDSPPAAQRHFASQFAQLPIAMQIETAAGLVGMVHADCPFPDWATLRDYLLLRLPAQRNTDEACQWSRARLKTGNRDGVRGVRAVIVGHTPVRVPKRLGNVVHIDTAGWSEGYFTFVDLASLRCHRV